MFLLIFLYSLISLEMRHCTADSSTESVISVPSPETTASIFCEALYNLHNRNDNITSSSKTKTWFGNKVNYKAGDKESFRNICKKTYESKIQYTNDIMDMRNTDDIAGFVTNFCTQDELPTNCLDHLRYNILDLDLGFGSAAEMCEQFKTETSGKCSQLLKFILERKIVRRKWLKMKNEELNCIRCAYHIPDCGPNTRQTLITLSQRIKEMKTNVLYNRCNIIWITDLLKDSTDKKKKNEILSLLLGTKQQYIANNKPAVDSSVCEKPDYEVIVPYLLSTKRPEHFKDPVVLGTICYNHWLRPNFAYPLELIEDLMDHCSSISALQIMTDALKNNYTLKDSITMLRTFFDTYQIEGGLQIVSTAAEYKFSFQLILHLHASMNGTAKQDIPKQTNKMLELMSVVHEGTKFMKSTGGQTNQSLEYFDKFVIPIVKALIEFHNNKK